MQHLFLRSAACLVASLALVSTALAQTRPAAPGANQPPTAASPSGTAATVPGDQRMRSGDLSRDCAPTAAGASTTAFTQSPGFRSEMSRCTSQNDRDRRADCVRDLWARSGGTAACL